IELIDVGSEEEEWRRFLGRDVDLIPDVRPAYRPYLAEVPSVRLVDLGEVQPVGLVFQGKDGPFSDPRLRRAVSLGLRRGAVARVVLGNAGGAAPMPEDIPAARRLIQEIRAEHGDLAPIKLMFLATASEDQRAALVIEQQLEELGLALTLQPASLEQINDVVPQHKFEIYLTYAGLTPINFRRFST